VAAGERERVAEQHGGAVLVVAVAGDVEQGGLAQLQVEQQVVRDARPGVEDAFELAVVVGGGFGGDLGDEGQVGAEEEVAVPGRAGARSART
jgi:allantoicase